ncbi:thioredoxin, mitochondrial [Arctopsyche grandis]|uniref:thioredoxin, mitochondrial n=1 Tax=Arctopsyche grandis TaxID=121162 RepID=UPI00406D8DD8
MSASLARGLRSPIRRILNISQQSREISTSLIHNDTIVVKNNDDFVDKVMNSDRPVIVNFHAEWCDPCKILTPKLRELIEPLDNLDLAVVDVEDHAELVHTFEVKAVPAVIAIRDGLVVDKFIGLVDATMIENLIKKLSGNKPNKEKEKETAS